MSVTKYSTNSGQNLEKKIYWLNELEKYLPVVFQSCDKEEENFVFVKVFLGVVASVRAERKDSLIPQSVSFPPTAFPGKPKQFN